MVMSCTFLGDTFTGVFAAGFVLSVVFITHQYREQVEKMLYDFRFTNTGYRGIVFAVARLEGM